MIRDRVYLIRTWLNWCGASVVDELHEEGI